MNPTLIHALPRFFLISGAVLIVTGVLKLMVRQPGPRETVLERWLNRTSLWAIFCMFVGVVGILIGLDVIPLRPGMFASPPPPSGLVR